MDEIVLVKHGFWKRGVYILAYENPTTTDFEKYLMFSDFGSRVVVLG